MIEKEVVDTVAAMLKEYFGPGNFFDSTARGGIVIQKDQKGRHFIQEQYIQTHKPSFENFTLVQIKENDYALINKLAKAALTIVEKTTLERVEIKIVDFKVEYTYSKSFGFA